MDDSQGTVVPGMPLRVLNHRRLVMRVVQTMGRRSVDALRQVPGGKVFPSRGYPHR